jgi:integrase/recombinase XerC
LITKDLRQQLRKLGQQPPQILEKDEVERLIAASGSGEDGPRNRAAVLMLYGTGVRTMELLGLKVADLDLERGTVFVRGKGRRQRYVPLPPAVAGEMLRYMRLRPKRGKALFVGRSGRAMANGDLRRMLKEAARRAAIAKAVVPKMLRHTYASHMMDVGVSLAVIARLMGHSTISETGVYPHAGRDAARAAMDLHPVGRLDKEVREDAMTQERRKTK